jgi:glycosidase
MTIKSKGLINNQPMSTILKKNIKNIKVLLVILTLTLPAFGCKKSPVSTKPVNPAAAEKDPAEYGTPFSEMPDRRDVSIYQVNIRTFSKEGNLNGVRVRLDSIKALGVNVVYLMPIYPVGVLKSVNSPYCVKDYKAVNSEFGSLDDLRQLIDEAHRLKMAVILDWVPNHTSFDNGWTSNKTWYLQDSKGEILSPPGTGWNDVAQLNFNNTQVRAAMIKAMKYWVYTANIDGFRCDYADGPPVDFWKQAIDSLRGISSHKLLLLAEGKRSLNYSAGFDYNFGFEFFGTLKSIFSNNQPVQIIDQQNEIDYAGSEEGQAIIRYISNHDVNSSDGSPVTLFGGNKGAMSAFVVAAYMKSVPMIYNGQEVGTPYKLTFPFTSTKIDWSINPEVTAEYKKVLAFRNGSQAIRRGALTSYSSADVCAFTKLAGPEKVFVLCNLRNESITYLVPQALTGNWKDGFKNTEVTLGTAITLEPYSYRVLKN